MHAADLVLLVSPEYNLGIAAAMKNANDVGSRSHVQNVWNNKPCAVISASPSTIGGMGANMQLRQSLVVLNAPCMPMECYLHSVHLAFNEQGELSSEPVQKLLAKFVFALQEWVNRFKE